jgi:hypothetical protein
MHVHFSMRPAMRQFVSFFDSRVPRINSVFDSFVDRVLSNTALVLSIAILVTGTIVLILQFRLSKTRAYRPDEIQGRAIPQHGLDTIREGVAGRAFFVYAGMQIA